MEPNGWEWTNLGKLTNKVGSGVTPKGGSNSYKSHGIPLIRSQNVLWGTLDLKDVAFIDDSQHEKMKGSIVCKGDVLLNITGASIGRAAVSNLDDANVNQHVCIIRSDRLAPEFLRDFLLSFNGQKQIEQFQAGGNRQGLNFEQIKSFKLPFPPLPEQRKIAKILSTWDKAISATERLIDNSKQQKKALMQQLLTGKKRLLDDSGKPFDEGWETALLKKCVTFLNGTRKPIKKEDRANIQGKYPYYGATGVIDYVNDYIFDDELILLGEDGVNIISRALPHVFTISGKSWVNNHAHVMKANEDQDTHFLCMYLESLDYKKYNSGSAQPKINKAVCEKICVRFPALKEQQKITSVLTNAEKEIELLKQQLTELKQEKKALMQQLLAGKRRVKV